MRTTLDIEKPILDELKRLRGPRKQTLGKVASSLLAEAIAQRKLLEARQAPRVDWQIQPMHPQVNLADKDVVYAILDDKGAE